MIPDIHNYFGDKIKLIFLTRLPKPSIVSYIKVMTNNKFRKEAIIDIWLASIGLPYDEKNNRLYRKLLERGSEMSIAEIISANYAAVMKGIELIFLILANSNSFYIARIMPGQAFEQKYKDLTLITAYIF